MNVWVAMVNYRGEGSDLIGIYADRASAQAACDTHAHGEVVPAPAWSPGATEWYSVEEHPVS